MTNAKIPIVTDLPGCAEGLPFDAFVTHWVWMFAVVASFDIADALPMQRNFGPSAHPSTLLTDPPAFQHVERLS